MKTDNLLVKDVQLLMNNSSKNDAFASITQNPHVTWIKFVLTDDKPNANGMRIPKAEFANIMRTGLHMPIKISEAAAEALELNHLGSKPIGTITHLNNNGDHIEALAALWDEERPEDVQLLKDRFENGQPIDISWELSYNPSKSNDTEEGHLDLADVSLNAATVVDFPSYMGRTPVLALAELSEEARAGLNTIMNKISRGQSLTEQETETLGAIIDAAKRDANQEVGALDEVMSKVTRGQSLTEQEAMVLRSALRTVTNSSIDNVDEILSRGEYNKMDTISREDHNKIVGDLEDQIENLQAELEEYEEIETKLEEANSELEEIKPEYEELVEFKEEYEEEQQRAEKLASIRDKFEEAGIKVDDEFLEEKEEVLLEMTEASLDFFIQEFVAFKEAQASTDDDDEEGASASVSLTSGIPEISSADDDVDTDDVVDYLRETLDN